MVRIAIPIWLLMAPLTLAQETTVWFTILGRGDVEEIEIGPEGGLVPYRLFVETDPLGTPGNLGISSLNVSIETNLGVAQARLKGELPPYLGSGVGAPQDDDVARIFGGPRCRTGPCSCSRTGLGQSGPQPIGRGHLVVPAAAPFTEFHAGIGLASETPGVHAARVLRASCSGGSRADRIFGNALTIRVVANPLSPADFDRDRDVDLGDYLRLIECYAGAGQDVPADCYEADLDWDGDVDLADVISLMGTYTGAN